MLDVLRHYYETDNANVHRGVHTLAERATKDYEASRERFANLSMPKAAEVLFTEATTSLNWIAKSYGDLAVTAGDEIVISYMEHHSNIIPTAISSNAGAILKYIDVTEDGFLDMASARQQITEKRKLFRLLMFQMC